MSLRLTFAFEICIPHIDISNEVLCTSNEDCMPMLRAQEVDVLIYPNVNHSSGTSSPRVMFLYVYGFTLFLNNKYAFEPHFNTFHMSVDTTSLLKDKIPSLELVYFHYVCKHISIL